MSDNRDKLDKIRGSLFGGAVGDALGYAVEFMPVNKIYERYGEKGITEYEIDKATGKALISDDTQMTLFTANGILVGETRLCMRGIGGVPSTYVPQSYQDWLKTQELSYDTVQDTRKADFREDCSWLLDVPELYSRRAPGNTCLSALKIAKIKGNDGDYLKRPRNNSKGCGGIMRVAPLGIHYDRVPIESLDEEGAILSAITHGHPLGYLPSAVLTHILNRIVYPKEQLTLKEIVLEAKETVCRLFQNTSNLDELCEFIDRAICLAENEDTDQDNIPKLGEGWVAEETLAIAIYCALRYEHDFSGGIIAAVNHNGDSDSTGAVTGNILGAINGYDTIEEKWKANLELKDVILEMADDLCYGCRMAEFGSYRDPDWERKYIDMRWKEPVFLEKYLTAHERSYKRALQEIKNGHKRTHWMWYIFPQIQGLGFSEISKQYALNSVDEAKQYMADETLRSHMLEICQALLELNTNNATEVLGTPDDMKLRSSMTLFSISNPEYAIFGQVLDKFFNGEEDKRTRRIISAI